MYTSILAALSSTQISQSEHTVFEMDQAEKEEFVISRNVLDEAISLAKSSGATLTLFHVLSEQEMQEGIKEFDGKEKFEQECLRRLNLLENEAESEGVDTVIHDQISFKLDSGKPGEMICEHARLWKNDLVIVGRREKHFHLFEPGSVSNYVIYHAPCTTFVVNPLVSISPNTNLT